MSWTFTIKGGKLTAPDGGIVGFGYSGYDDGDGATKEGEGKGDPNKTHLKGIGPIPEGRWRFGPPFFHKTCGPYVLRLYPMAGTTTFGRSGFLIHGDSVSKPGTASQGCIILSRNLRMMLWESGDHEIIVISGNEVRKDIA